MTRHWRNFAACRDQAPAFDNYVDGESPNERTARIKAAVATCNGCPVLTECKADIDILLDDGVRAGMVLERTRNVPAGGGRGIDGRALKPIVHDTARGYAQHRRRGEKPCQLCREAQNRDKVDRTTGRRAS